MQYFQRTYDYIHEYQRLVYDYYSKIGVAFLVTYYNIDTLDTVWEDEYMMNGPYEKIGNLTGLKWKKYLLLPVYFIDEMNTQFDGSEVGYIKENETTMVIPSSFGLQPYPNDIVKLEQEYLRPTNDVYPVFTVTGIEKSTNADRSFFKMKLMIEQSRTLTEVENQVTDTYTFFEYTKKIYELTDSVFLTNVMYKNETCKDRLKDMFDQNSGFYFV